VYRGWYESRGTVINDERLRYIEEGIYSGQVSGDHLISKLGDSIVTWRLTYSRATLDEPDLRESIYEFDPSTRQFRFYSQLQSGLRMFNTMRENLREPAIDWSKFFFAGKMTVNLKAGASRSNRDRGFASRRFRFNARGSTGIDFTAAAERLFAAENIRSDGFEILEETRQTDAYQGAHDITAGYGMSDFALKKWRIIGGVRVERSDQQVQTFNLFNRDLNPVLAGQDKTDLMPSLGVVYSLSNKMNLRVGYSQTVARPQFRELSPFEFTDVTGGPSAVGNPDLVRTRVRNFDARWEWFVSAQELVAVSFFYKKLLNPIEQVIQPSNELTIVSYRNVEGAKNWGFEFEVRKNLGFLSPRLTSLSLMSNYTYVSSNVIIGQQQLSVVTSLERPLVGQAKNVFNSTVQYEIPRWGVEARTLVNFVGKRISDVGAFGLPDIQEDGYPSVDFFLSKRFLGEAKRLELKLSGENLVDRQVRFNQGPNPYWYYNRGRTFSMGVSYTIF
jgi:TonB-dependent receptor